MQKKHYLYKLLGIHIPKGYEEDAQACSEVYLTYNLQLIAPPWPLPPFPLTLDGLRDVIALNDTLSEPRGPQRSRGWSISSRTQRDDGWDDEEWILGRRKPK